jgi:hypothetical protein
LAVVHADLPAKQNIFLISTNTDEVSVSIRLEGPVLRAGYERSRASKPISTGSERVQLRSEYVVDFVGSIRNILAEFQIGKKISIGALVVDNRSERDTVLDICRTGSAYADVLKRDSSKTRLGRNKIAQKKLPPGTESAAPQIRLSQMANKLFCRGDVRMAML